MMHHEILGQRFGTEILQEEADMAQVKVGDAATFGGHGESQVFVELLGQLEVSGWHKRLDFRDCQVGHALLQVTPPNSNPPPPGKPAVTLAGQTGWPCATAPTQ